MVEAEAEMLKSFLEHTENPENKFTLRVAFEVRLINGEPGMKVRRRVADGLDWAERLENAVTEDREARAMDMGAFIFFIFYAFF